MRKTSLLLLLTLLGSAPAALAQMAHPGRLLASNCFQCHGTDGRSTLGFDRLAGKSVNDIYGELLEMRAEVKLKPGSEGIMGVHAMGYTDAQTRLLADYFSKQAR